MDKLKEFDYNKLESLTLTLEEVGEISDYIEELEEKIQEMTEKITELEYDPMKCSECGIRASSVIKNGGRCWNCS